MRISIGADHSGFVLKTALVRALAEWGHEVHDVGTHTGERIDFPDVAAAVCEPVRSGEADRGVVLCGSGIGVSIAANKLGGIRAALCHDGYSAHQAVEHDDANVLCLGGQIVGERLGIELLKTFLDAEYSRDPYFELRLRKIEALERNAAGSVVAAPPD